MYRIQTLNEISPIIHEELPADAFAIGPDMENPDGILVRSADMLSKELNPNLLAIARAGAGYNNVPVDRCSKAGIVVFNTPGANANAVKEMVICGMLLGSRRVVQSIDWVRTLKGKGDQVPALVEKGKSQFVGPELKGKKLGVIGLGATGGMVANAAYALGMRVVGYDPTISVEAAWRLSRAVKRANSLEELVPECDYISVHVPLMPATKHLFNAELYKQFKRGTVLLNFSRAELVEPEDTRAALKDGTLWSYVVDFPTDDMIGVENVIAIPHLASSTPESEENCASMASAQVREYLQKGNIRNSVNFPDVELPHHSGPRVAICHLNVPNMIGQSTSAVADAGINIANMVNRSRKDMAYTVLDLDGVAPSEALIQRIFDLDGVLRVRIL